MADDLSVTMGGDNSKLVRELAQAEAKISKLTTALKKTGKAGDTAGKKLEGVGRKARDAGLAGQRAFGGQVLGGLKSYAAGVLSVGAAIGLATRALAAMSAERAKAAQAVRATIAPEAQLAQLAGGDSKELKRLLGEVRKTRLATGASSEEAAGLQFSLESLGEGARRKFFAGFHQIADPASLAEGAATLKAAFGEGETGNVREITNKLLKASAASKTTIGQFSPAATIAAQTAQAIGGSDEELLATVAILSRATKSADVGATQVSSLADVIGSKGLGGRGVLAAIPDIKQLLEGKTAGEVEKFFGRKEARKGFFAIDKLLPQIRELEKGIIGAAETGPSDLSSRVKASFFAQEKFRRVRAADRAKQDELLGSEEGLGLVQVTRDEARSRVMARSLRRGESQALRAGKGLQADLLNFFGASPETIKSVGESLVPGAGAGMQEFEDKLVGTVSDIITGRFINYLFNPLGGGLSPGAEHRTPDPQTEASRALSEAARDLKAAARELKDARGGGTTLAKPDDDR